QVSSTHADLHSFPTRRSSDLNSREVYFHRADLREDTPFNTLEVDDALKFDLIEDSVSGARALRVTRQARAPLTESSMRSNLSASSTSSVLNGVSSRRSAR